VGGFLTLGVLAGLTWWPVTIRQGVDFKVTIQRIPLYAKISGFFYRDWYYRKLVVEIVDPDMSEKAKTIAIYEWVRVNLRPHQRPQDGPVYDDHVLNVILRGTGVADQFADVFTTLLSYAGIRAGWHRVTSYKSGGQLIITTVYLDGHWRVFDPYYGNVFRNGEGRLATFEELVNDPTLAKLIPNQPIHHGVPYAHYLEELGKIDPTMGFSRGERQKPFMRLWWEIRHHLGREDM
jgi:hypothetical protein